MAKKKIEFLAVAKEKEVIDRCQLVTDEFGYSFAHVDNIDKYAELSTEDQEAYFILLCAIDEKSEASIAGMVQIAKQMSHESFVMVVVNKRVSPDGAQFIKKSGASLVIVEHELFNSSKLDYIAAQKIRASYLPAKSSEFKKDTTINFGLYHLLPLNKKFLPVAHSGSELTEQRIAKINQIGEVYVRREDLKLYEQYLRDHPDLSAAGLKSRCRAQFLLMQSGYIDLALMLSDQSESASFSYGKTLLDTCTKYASDLLMTLATVGEAFDVINNSSIGEFGTVDRAPAIASYAGLISLMSGVGKPEEIMLSAMIADLGMLDLSPNISRAIRNETTSQLPQEDLALYQKHPLISLNVSLSRRLPIGEGMKDIILNTHEKNDGTGFPNRSRGEKIPHEAQLIQFCELIDRGSLIKMGKERKSAAQVRKEIFDRDFTESKYFNILFLDKIKSVI